MSSLSCLKRENAPDLAYVYVPATGTGKSLPVVMFCGGFKSDMEGTKALYLEEQCAERGQGFIRFDYRGHGQSEGEFIDGTIGLWKQDALDILNHISPESVVLVGSSMGGWIALLLMEACPDKIAGLIGIAAAPDFTKSFYNDELTAQLKQELVEKGFVHLPNDYSDEPYIITKALIDDGDDNLFMDQQHSFFAPVHLIQGMKDADVPWQTAHRIKNVIDGDVVVTLIEDGDHRLSRPQDLELLDKSVQDITA
jgi:pimeloyl-ACP methyl ester carboxylesterase